MNTKHCRAPGQLKSFFPLVIFCARIVDLFAKFHILGDTRLGFKAVEKGETRQKDGSIHFLISDRSTSQ